jgi:hypothetical protein
MRASTRRTVASPGGRLAGPLADRGQGARAGQHGSHRDGQHRAQRMPSATPMPWIGDLGEVVQQAPVLLGRQGGWHIQPMGNARNRQ